MLRFTEYFAKSLIKIVLYCIVLVTFVHRKLLEMNIKNNKQIIN